MHVRCTPESLREAVAVSVGWADLMRRLGLHESGGQRRALQRMVAELGLATDHFKRRSPWLAYSDEAMATAVAASSTLRQVATALGAAPASGTLSHLRRRIAAAGIDVSHFPGMNRARTELPFSPEELTEAAARSNSVRAVARLLGVPDDGRSRAALGRTLREQGVPTNHFRNARLSVMEGDLRAVVPGSKSYADVMRALGLPVNDTNHRRVRRQVARLGLDTSHFARRTWGSMPTRRPAPTAAGTLLVLPEGSLRTNRARLHRAMQETGVPYRCVSCGNEGQWLGRPITLQIDHLNGDRLDNRAGNLRYLCPNCHALTATWCRKKARTTA